MEGFAEFVEAETPRLFGLAYALTGNSHDAWDLVQEALARVGLRWRRLADQSPGGYARTTLVHLNLRRVRSVRREVVTEVIAEWAAPVVLDEPVEPWLLEGLALLTPHQRSAVVLRVVVGLGHADIAEQLGCAEGTARTHLSRGLARMREHATAHLEVKCD